MLLKVGNFLYEDWAKMIIVAVRWLPRQRWGYLILRCMLQWEFSVSWTALGIPMVIRG